MADSSPSLASRSRRQSRGNKPKSYRAADYYAGIIEDDSSPGTGSSDSESESPDGRREKEDEDDFVPPVGEEEEEDQDEDFADDDAAEEDDGAADGEIAGESIVELYSDDEIETATPRKAARVRHARESTDMTIVSASGQSPARPLANLAKGSSMKVRTMGADDPRSQNRGVIEWGGGGQEMRVKDLFGPSHEDLKPVLKTRDHWAFQLTLPSRKQGSLCRSYYVNEDAREREIRVTRNWYWDTGREAFIVGQKSRKLSETEGKTYMVTDESDSVNILLGSYRDPQLYTLKKGSYVSASAPFATKGRRGWILNLGGKIRDLQWTTNEEGNTQYLAVAVHQNQPKTPGRRSNKPLENPKAPAYTATKPFPASIQIWAFDADTTGDLDLEREPRLELVICTDWGAPKKLRWCPVGTKDTVGPIPDSNAIHLGLLAGIWSDGSVRILDTSHERPERDSPETQYIHYSQAAFDVRIPDTVPTCIHWLSGTNLAVATAHGTLAIWCLTRPGTFPPSSQSTAAMPCSPRPWFVKQIADTFIITLTSGWPSRPNFISITTADGFSRLYDLRSPNADMTPSLRGRMLITTQAWHEHTQSFVMPDEHYFLRHNSLRRYYSNVYSARMNSTIAVCATSPVQPAVLLGGADGTAIASNPTARVLNSKEIPWRQIWFSHEWRPPVDKLAIKIQDLGVDTAVSTDTATAATTPSTPVPRDSDHTIAPPNPPTPSTPLPSETTALPTRSTPSPAILAQPLIRMTEGYRAQQMVLQHSALSNSNADGTKLVTIYEERSAITAMAWNGNLRFGTWAAAGMGSGILRVEDLGV